MPIFLSEKFIAAKKNKSLRAEKLLQIMFFFSDPCINCFIDMSINYESTNQKCSHMVFIELYLCTTANSLSHLIAGSFAAKAGKMEATSKPEKQQQSSFVILQRVLIFIVVFTVCVAFFVGLLLVKTRLNSLEETVNDLSEVCKTPSGGKS